MPSKELNSLFSSNQLLDITCDFDALPHVIDFAFSLSGDKAIMTGAKRSSPAFQITKDLYCLGTSYGNWQKYPFHYNPFIIADIITQWIKRQPNPEPTGTDGIENLGCRCRSIVSALKQDAAKTREIETPYNSILCIEPYNLAYDK